MERFQTVAVHLVAEVALKATSLSGRNTRVLISSKNEAGIAASLMLN